MLLFKKILKWGAGILALAFVALVIVRMFHFENVERTNEAVAKIHATKLTLDDVMGKNLPPVPANPDATVQGVDANTNGIRDDVELAIFKEYPDSAKTRAVLLQYALALQMEMTQEIENERTATAVAQEKSQASMCIGEIFSRDNIQKFFNETEALVDFVKKLQINNKIRDVAQINFAKKVRSYSSLDETCDVDLSVLQN